MRQTTFVGVRAMQAAVVRSFDRPPTYDDYPEPTASDADEVLVRVVAAGLHPRVRSAADGSHYTSEGALPMVPGIDGVGRTADGEVEQAWTKPVQPGVRVVLIP